MARVRTTSPESSQSSSVGSQDTNLVRLRSPWAGGEWGGVWSGAWSERSWEWNALSERDRELLASRSQHEGEFWCVVYLNLFLIFENRFMTLHFVVYCCATK